MGHGTCRTLLGWWHAPNMVLSTSLQQQAIIHTRGHVQRILTHSRAPQPRQCPPVVSTRHPVQSGGTRRSCVSAAARTLPPRVGHASSRTTLPPYRRPQHPVPAIVGGTPNAT